MTREPGLGFRLIQGDDDYGIRRDEDGNLEFFGKTKIDPYAISKEIIKNMMSSEEELNMTGYFGGFTPMIAASIMQLQGEPLDPAYNQLWAQGVPNLGIEASVYRATSNYTMGPHKIAPAYQGPTIEGINELIDKFRDLHGNMPFEFVYEPFRMDDRFKLGLPVPPLEWKEDGNLIPPSLTQQIMEDLSQEYTKQVDAELVGRLFNIPLCLLGEKCDHVACEPAWEFPRESEWKRKLHILLGKLRWARERFARRVYELISEYNFEEEEVDW